MADPDPDHLPHHADARAQLAHLRAQLAKRPDGYVTPAEREQVRRLEVAARHADAAEAEPSTPDTP